MGDSPGAFLVEAAVDRGLDLLLVDRRRIRHNGSSIESTPDGNGKEKLSTTPGLHVGSVSEDGRFTAVHTAPMRRTPSICG